MSSTAFVSVVEDASDLHLKVLPTVSPKETAMHLERH